MSLSYRSKRVLKELLGLRQYPRKTLVKPANLEEQIYSDLIEPGDVCFDIGANRGEIAIYMARCVGSTGVVVAFEPVPRIFRDLCRCVQDDGFEKGTIATMPMGISDKTGVATITIPGEFWYRGSLAPSSRWKSAQEASGGYQFECDFTTLDAFLQRGNFPRPSFLKIDVEGAELLVLRGGWASFNSGFRPLIVMELFAPWQKAFGYGPWDVLSILMGFGYRVLFVCPEGLVEHEPSQAAPFPSEYTHGYNIVAFMPDSHGERIRRLARLRRGAGDKIPPMAPPPVPNM